MNPESFVSLAQGLSLDQEQPQDVLMARSATTRFPGSVVRSVYHRNEDYRGMHERDDISIALTLDGTQARSSSREVYNAALDALESFGVRPGLDGIECSKRDYERITRYNRGAMNGIIAFLGVYGYDIQSNATKGNAIALAKIEKLSLTEVVNAMHSCLLNRGAVMKELMPEVCRTAKKILTDRLLMLVAQIDYRLDEPEDTDRRTTLQHARTKNVVGDLASWISWAYRRCANIHRGDVASNSAHTVAFLLDKVESASRFRDFKIILTTVFSKVMSATQLERLTREYTEACERFVIIPGVDVEEFVILRSAVEGKRLNHIAANVEWRNSIYWLNEHSVLNNETAAKATEDHGHKSRDVEQTSSFKCAGLLPPQVTTTGRSPLTPLIEEAIEDAGMKNTATTITPALQSCADEFPTNEMFSIEDEEMLQSEDQCLKSRILQESESSNSFPSSTISESLKDDATVVGRTSADSLSDEPVQSSAHEPVQSSAHEPVQSSADELTQPNIDEAKDGDTTLAMASKPGVETQTGFLAHMGQDQMVDSVVGKAINDDSCALYHHLSDQERQVEVTTCDASLTIENTDQPVQVLECAPLSMDIDHRMPEPSPSNIDDESLKKTKGILVESLSTSAPFIDVTDDVIEATANITMSGEAVTSRCTPPLAGTSEGINTSLLPSPFEILTPLLTPSVCTFSRQGKAAPTDIQEFCLSLTQTQASDGPQELDGCPHSIDSHMSSPNTDLAMTSTVPSDSQARTHDIPQNVNEITMNEGMVQPAVIDALQPSENVSSQEPLEPSSASSLQAPMTPRKRRAPTTGERLYATQSPTKNWTPVARKLRQSEHELKADGSWQKTRHNDEGELEVIVLTASESPFKVRKEMR